MKSSAGGNASVGDQGYSQIVADPGFHVHLPEAKQVLHYFTEDPDKQILFQAWLGMRLSASE